MTLRGKKTGVHLDLTQFRGCLFICWLSTICKMCLHLVLRFFIACFEDFGRLGGFAEFSDVFGHVRNLLEIFD